ncbi:hypothetical protein PISMIDRAFT_16668 [Pisolithus microcarpus 441]|uniref:Uncharacterized protein n=1 Tax=Pisolithus microcarpus 441 TaxID=765257 RepID=A0A0C9Z5D1_9AGAM|nr:hypothetical protein PISMIDRAFT_16668 [Pisolithus microcarpus 441]
MPYNIVPECTGVFKKSRVLRAVGLQLQAGGLGQLMKDVLEERKQEWWKNWVEGNGQGDFQMLVSPGPAHAALLNDGYVH